MQETLVQLGTKTPEASPGIGPQIFMGSESHALDSRIKTDTPTPGHRTSARNIRGYQWGKIHGRKSQDSKGLFIMLHFPQGRLGELPFIPSSPWRRERPSLQGCSCHWGHPARAVGTTDTHPPLRGEEGASVLRRNIKKFLAFRYASPYIWVGGRTGNAIRAEKPGRFTPG